MSLASIPLAPIVSPDRPPEVRGRPRRPSRRARRGRLARLDDLALLAAVLERRPFAFEVFFGRHRRLILACLRRTAEGAGMRLQAEDLADLANDVAEALLARDLHRLRAYRPDGGCSVSSWVGLVACSVARDALRRARRRPLDYAPLEALEPALPPAATPWAALEERERWALVNRALSGLSARDRRFVRLYYAEARSPEAIARELGVSVATVYSKKAKIQGKLASSVAASGHWGRPQRRSLDMDGACRVTVSGPSSTTPRAPRVGSFGT